MSKDSNLLSTGTATAVGEWCRSFIRTAAASLVNNQSHTCDFMHATDRGFAEREGGERKRVSSCTADCIRLVCSRCMTMNVEIHWRDWYMNGGPVQSETGTFPAFGLSEELHQKFLWIGREDCVIWLASVWYTFGKKMTLSVKRVTKFSQWKGSGSSHKFLFRRASVPGSVVFIVTS